MFKNLSAKWQLGLGFGVVIGLLVATLVTVVVLLNTLSQHVGNINDRSLPMVLAVDEMNLSRSDVQQFLTDVSATHDPDGYKDADEAAKRFNENAEICRQYFHANHDAESLQKIEDIETKFNAFYSLGKVMAATYVRDGMEAGNAIMKGDDTNPGFDKASGVLLNELTAFRKSQVTWAQTYSAVASGTAHAIRDVVLVGGMIIAFIAIAFGVLIVRGLMEQLGGDPKLAVALAQRVASGNLSQVIALKDGDRSSLLYHLGSMQETLGQIVGDVRRGAESVGVGSRQIAEGNLDLSNRTETQAGLLVKSVSAMEVLGAAVNQNSESAMRANQLAQDASLVAVKGGAVVAEVVNTMRGINEASRKISDIIQVIDGIAFQTNILALNAAVEAARAGEQGRGFAVVASEVRSLAGRSAEAAKEIKQLINASVDRVAQGTSQVDQAGNTMTEVVESIQRVTDIVQLISTESLEQAHSVQQIQTIVAQIGESTQQNAALAEEATAAASSLQSQAMGFVKTVDIFNLHSHEQKISQINYARN